MIDRPTAMPTLASRHSLDLRADLLRLVNGFAQPNASIVLDGTHTNRPAHQPGAVALLHLRWTGDPLPQVDTLAEYPDLSPVPTAASVAFGPDILVGVVIDVPTAAELEDRDDLVMWMYYHSECETDPALIGLGSLTADHDTLVTATLGSGATLAPEETPGVLLSTLLYQHLGIPLKPFNAFGLHRCSAPGYLHWCVNH